MLKLAQTWLSEEERRWRSKGGGGGGGGGGCKGCLWCVVRSWWIWAGMVRGRGG